MHWTKDCVCNIGLGDILGAHIMVLFSAGHLLLLTDEKVYENMIINTSKSEQSNGYQMYIS